MRYSSAPGTPHTSPSRHHRRAHLLRNHSILLPAHEFPCLFILRCILRRIQSPIVSADHLLARVLPGYPFVEPREFPSLRPSDRVTNSLVCASDNSSSKLVNFRRFGTARLAIPLLVRVLPWYPFVNSREFPSFPPTSKSPNHASIPVIPVTRHEYCLRLVARAMTITSSPACSPDSRSSFLVNFRRFETDARRRSSSPFLLL